MDADDDNGNSKKLKAIWDQGKITVLEAIVHERRSWGRKRTVRFWPGNGKSRHLIYGTIAGVGDVDWSATTVSESLEHSAGESFSRAGNSSINRID